MAFPLSPEVSAALLRQNLEWMAARMRAEVDAEYTLEDAGILPYGCLTGRIGPSIEPPESIELGFERRGPT